MKRSLTYLATVTLLGIAAASLLQSAATAAKPASDTAVTSTIDGLGVDTLPTLRIQSDQAGSYRNSNSLQSILQAAVGDWVLDTLNFNSSPQRKVLIDLRDMVSRQRPWRRCTDLSFRISTGASEIHRAMQRLWHRHANNCGRSSGLLSSRYRL
ncbi:MAG TPA: hypothetical protein VN956_17075 [Pyrinomonadaceae bacterium]|nr:hypothetical protein [Pyrinomonadaceae bacterium]